MNMIGLTGTNGKTSTTYMIKSICEERGHKVGLIGTIKNLIGDKEIHTDRTTPESMDLQALLAQMAEEGVDTVVMEVSSHSLALKRVAGIQFDVGVFTNLTQDHLDFHGDFEHYAQAKRMLCNMSAHMAINGDDAYGEYMCKSDCPDHFLYGVHCGQMRAIDPEITPKGTAFTLSVDGQETRIEIAISGIFTVYNALAAAAAAYKMGYTLEEIRRGLKKMACVPGRFEALDTRGGGYDVILDYAHTPDSLENTLKTIRGFAPGRVVCIVGCGGNRDAKKRPIMAEIAGKYADYTILTSDNPRFEEPMDILAQMEVGIKGKGYDYTIVESRRDAIKLALKNAQPNEIILLAGKGHEDYQEIRGVKHPFDEKVVVSQLLDELERESAKE